MEQRPIRSRATQANHKQQTGLQGIQHSGDGKYNNRRNKNKYNNDKNNSYKLILKKNVELQLFYK